jgi:hypothetical protein
MPNRPSERTSRRGIGLRTLGRLDAGGPRGVRYPSTTGRFSVRPTSGVPVDSSGDCSARVLGSMGQRSGEMRACDRGDLRLALNEAACHRPGLLNPPRVRRSRLDWSIMPRNGQIFGHVCLPRRVSGRYSTYRRTLAAGQQLRLQREDRSRTAAHRAAPTITKRAGRTREPYRRARPIPTGESREVKSEGPVTLDDRRLRGAAHRSRPHELCRDRSGPASARQARRSRCRPSTEPPRGRTAQE